MISDEQAAFSSVPSRLDFASPPPPVERVKTMPSFDVALMTPQNSPSLTTPSPSSQDESHNLHVTF